MFFYRELSWLQVPKTLLIAANTSAIRLYIITNAIRFSFLMTSEQIPQGMSQWVIDLHLQPWMFLLMVNFALLAAGQFTMMVNMEKGMIHPPVGLNLFVSSHLAKEGLTEVSIANLSWVGVMLV